MLLLAHTRAYTHIVPTVLTVLTRLEEDMDTRNRTYEETRVGVGVRLCSRAVLSEGVPMATA